MIRISRFTRPRATVGAIALLAAAMLAFGALSAEEREGEARVAEQSVEAEQTRSVKCALRNPA